MRVECPHCGHGATVPTEYAGVAIGCKACDRKFTVPAMARAMTATVRSGGALSCPRCAGPADTQGRGCLIWACAILLFPIGLVLLLLPLTYRCRECGYLFKA